MTKMMTTARTRDSAISRPEITSRFMKFKPLLFIRHKTVVILLIILFIMPKHNGYFYSKNRVLY